MGQLNQKIFGNKTLADLAEEIYKSQQKKHKQIDSLINQLKVLIVDLSDATLIVPLLKDYLDVSVKNDDQLVKLGNLVQKALNSVSGDNGLGLSNTEKENLYQTYQDIKNTHEE